MLLRFFKATAPNSKRLSLNLLKLQISPDQDERCQAVAVVAGDAVSSLNTEEPSGHAYGFDKTLLRILLIIPRREGASLIRGLG